MLKQRVNRWMISTTWNHKMTTIVEKKNVPTIERETKIPFLTVICGSIDFLIWIKVEVEHGNCLLKNPNKSLILGTPKNALVLGTQPKAYKIPVQWLHCHYISTKKLITFSCSLLYVFIFNIITIHLHWLYF
jgi:hypothetical protein